MAITGQVRSPLGYGEAMVDDWRGAGLIKASVLKPVFSTIEQRLVMRVIGHLSAADMQTLQRLLRNVIG
jgi:mRNA interferase MazF